MQQQQQKKKVNILIQYFDLIFFFCSLFFNFPLILYFAQLKLINITDERFEHLVSQMQFRLSEGQGKAIYRIGVSDSGELVRKKERKPLSANVIYSKKKKSFFFLKQLKIEDLK